MARTACWLLVALVVTAARADIVFEPDTDGDKYRLPEGFLLGAGTSSYQSEGAWNVNGKGQNVFDYYYNVQNENNSRISRLNGNVASDAYHHVDDDIGMIEKLKFKVHRFSLSWARILPDGDPSKPNADGIRYYNETITKLLAIGVEPLITLYHFDHPQALHVKYNSWLGEGMIDAFVDFADFAFKTFGDKVKYWTTLNEPNMYCMLVSAGAMAPSSMNGSYPDDSFYKCFHNQMLAHGKTYRLYHDKYAGTQKGKVGLSYYSDINRPNSTSTADVEAAERANAFRIGLSVNPVIFGDYPESVVAKIAEESRAKNRSTWLPTFTEDQKTMMKNSVDFLGPNIYFGGFVAAPSGEGSSAAAKPTRWGSFHNPRSDDDVQDIRSAAQSGPGPFGHAFSLIQPWSIQESLMYVKEHYGDIPIFITENGYEDDQVYGIHDQPRAAYHSAYLRAMIDTIHDSNVTVLGMTVWTLIDDLEWSRSNNSKMGLVHVDFSTPDRTRTLKDSSAFFIKLANEGKVPLVLVKGENATTESPRNPSTSTPANAASLATWTCYLLIGSVLLALKPLP